MLHRIYNFIQAGRHFLCCFGRGGVESPKKFQVSVTPSPVQPKKKFSVVVHRGVGAPLLYRRCLVEVPNAPRHRAERAHADADLASRRSVSGWGHVTHGARALLPNNG